VSLRYTAQFFSEKLDVPVEYFNPLRNVQIDPSINLEELARVAHSLGEVVGLGLRNLAHCPVELNLMPESTLKWQSFNQKKPYFIATVFSLVAGIAAVGFLFAQLADVKKTQLAKTQEELEPQQRRAEQFRKAYGDLQKIRSEADQIVGYVDARYQWADILSELREVLIRVEATTKSKLRSDTGVWVERLNTIAARSDEPAAATAAVSEDDNPARSRAADLAFRRRYRLPIPGEGGGGDAAPENGEHLSHVRAGAVGENAKNPGLQRGSTLEARQSLKHP